MNAGRLITAALSLLLLALSTYGYEYRYSIGGRGSSASLRGGNFFHFDKETSYGFNLGHRLSDGWLFDISYEAFEFSNDVARDSTSSIGDLSNNSTLDFRAARLSLMLRRLVFSSDRWLNMTLGIGGGPMFWKAVNPDSNTTYKVEGDRRETTDYAATEVLLSASTALVVAPHSRLSFNLFARADYFTGADAEFADDIKSVRDRWLYSMGIDVNFHFGRRDVGARSLGNEKPQLQLLQHGRRTQDSDNDGIPDDTDECLNTPYGVLVDRSGCPLDSDRDGVPDGMDDCPGTSIEAQEAVDIHGCPVDSDFDGYGDFLDACPNNLIGALVDSIGCPVDRDNDGIPDGLDDCPYTLVGVSVDRNGCIALTMLSEPMVLNIAYDPGSFEIDPNSKNRLKRLAGLLNFVIDIRLEISGYTDNIGQPAANKQLSEKRARRVRDYLVSLGIAPERIRVFGRGETNFVASNQTAEGRSRNRRIEIVFHK